jgi:hypothetical protein
MEKVAVHCNIRPDRIVEWSSPRQIVVSVQVLEAQCILETSVGGGAGSTLYDAL